MIMLMYWAVDCLIEGKIFSFTSQLPDLIKFLKITKIPFWLKQLHFATILSKALGKSFANGGLQV